MVFELILIDLIVIIDKFSSICINTRSSMLYVIDYINSILVCENVKLTFYSK